MHIQSSTIFESEKLPMKSIIIPSREGRYSAGDEPVIHQWICLRKIADDSISGLQVTTADFPSEER